MVMGRPEAVMISGESPLIKFPVMPAAHPEDGNKWNYLAVTPNG